MRILQLGDISGQSGMSSVFLGLKSLKKEEKIDFVIANGENASQGFGISGEDYLSLISMGIDVITSGNHIWQKEDIFPFLDKMDNIIRPVNYPDGVPGKGWTIKDNVAVINAQGRVNMPSTDCPFRTVKAAVEKIRKTTKIIFVDFHAEETSEKEALAFYLDGLVSCVAGTHTHVQTADEKILSAGTAYITDLGITGVLDSVIGSREDLAIERALTQLPIKSEVKQGKASLSGIIVDVDDERGRALSIRRIIR